MGFRLFLPILLLAMAALLACSGDGDATPRPAALLPTQAPVEPARPLSADELAAVEQFEEAMQDIEADWDSFYQEFDTWRTGLTSCHPSAGRESLRDFAGSFAAVSESARNLPRTTVSSELADLVIAAADAEDTALRQLRDRWQAGNITLFEAVEQKRAESAAAQNSVADMSLTKQEELEAGPTAGEVEFMQGFSLAFDGIADAWDDYHDNYAALARRESKLESDALVEGYEELIQELGAIIASIGELEASEINKDMIEVLQDAAEDELAALEFLAEFPPEPEESDESEESDMESQTEPTEPVARALSAPAQRTAPTPAPTQGSPPAQEQGQGQAPPTAQDAPKVPSQTPPATEPPPSSAVKDEKDETVVSPQEELSAAIEATEGILEELDKAIQEIVDDDSAVRLQELQDFDEALAGFVNEWSEFYEGYASWRLDEGGCDRVEVAADLALFSQQAGELAGTARDLPQSGPLVSVYSLVAEAADREAGGFRTLSNSWTPFAVDVFKAVDDERVNARRLRRQAGIALEELRSRQ